MTYKILFILFILSIFNARADYICATVDRTGYQEVVHLSLHKTIAVPTQTCVNLNNIVTNRTSSTSAIVYKTKEEKKYLGLTKRELIVIGLSIGIGFAIAEYQIRVKPNAIELSVPIE